MPGPKRVLCLMDLSAVGRSSLVEATSVLAACGVQPCPLPTALYSTHTLGFGAPATQDTADFVQQALAHYKQQGTEFDAVYTGYLQTPAQFAAAGAAFAQYPGAFLVADPAIGDGGKMYSGISSDAARQMQTLCRQANLITPNFTESALLLGEAPQIEPLAPAQMAQRMARLAGDTRHVLVTSVPTHSGMEIWGCAPGGQDIYRITAYHVPQSYPGTGDLFTAATLGLMLRGLSLRDAATAAADFIRSAAISTLREGGDARHGIWFEPQLSMLSLLANSTATPAGEAD